MNAEKPESKSRHYCSFRINEYLFGVDVHDVQEILPLSRSTRIPLTPDSIEGMINLRGRVVTIVNLCKVLSETHVSSVADKRFHFVSDQKTGLYSFIVDGTGEVYEIDDTDISQLPHFVPEELRQFLVGAVRLEQESLLLLSISRVLSYVQRLCSQIHFSKS